LVLLGDWNRILFHSGLRYRDLAAKAQVNLDEALTQVEVSARESKLESQAAREA